LRNSKRQSWRITGLRKSSNTQQITKKENSSQTRFLRLATWKMKSFAAKKELNLCTSTFKIFTNKRSLNGMNQFLLSRMMVRIKMNPTIKTVRKTTEELDDLNNYHKTLSPACKASKHR
jgi:hypothetical protein